MASFSVVSNVSAVNAQANLTTTNLGLQKALERLSSGYRINRSGDDAAGLVVANQYRSEIAVLTQGLRNAGDGLSVLQIKDGALNNIATLLDRLSTLATQAASASSSVDRTILDREFQDVLTEIDREASVAGLDQAEGFSVFVSADGSNGTVGGQIGAVSTAALGLTGLNVLDAADAATAVTTIDAAVATLGQAQATVGTIQNRLQFAMSLAQSQITNTKAAESRIRDANIAEESANLTRYSILTQSGIAALAQANANTGSVLALLR
ncbi:MAG: flagellin [Acidobacteriota bacterium]|jgi:flagellin|nr:MAG: flagellin FliC [Acidobacteriota bacterium]